PIFFTLLIFCPVVSSDSDCFWQGKAMFCDPDDCPAGSTEITRHGYSYNYDFGKYFFVFRTCWTGKKVLCCKNS
ncbi:hypothetical protein PMAYCL1PPCAC_09773, partial [Pristionchus mayeri]